jgi:hypothetical protein
MILLALATQVKGLWVPVVALDVIVDCLDQVLDAAKCPSANLFPCDFGKPAFNLIEPGRTGGREMNVIAGPRL